MEKSFSMNKKDVVASPKDEILNGIIIDINKTTWAGIIPEDKIGKFDDPNKEIVQIKFECKYENNVLKGEDVLPYYGAPMSNSKLGKFLIKYDSLKVGKEIKVIYDGDGFGKIKVD